MKKLSFIMFAIVFSLGGLFVAPSFTSAVDEPPIVVSTASDFVSKVKGSANIKLGGNLDFRGGTINAEEFSGKLDGNGYTISNFVIKSDNHNYGLISHLNGGEISNLKLDGSVEYDFSSSSQTPVNVGLVAGLVSNGGIIKNCEITNLKINTVGKENLSFTTQFTYGGIAGAVINEKSAVTNCVNHSSVDLSTSLSATNLMRVGGIVGRLHDGSVSFCNARGNITYAAVEIDSSITFYNGGIIGDVEGSSTKAYNLTFEGEISRNSETDYSTSSSRSGGIVGRISSLADLEQIDLSNCYWTNEDLERAFDEDNGYTFDPQYVRYQKDIQRVFYTNSENWHKRYGEWDFGKTWIMSSVLHLQCFQSFNYSFNDYVDPDGIIDEERSSIPNICKYGEKVEIRLQIKDEYKGYYTLKQVLLNSAPMNDYTVVDDSANGRYTITFDSNDRTDGSYSFKMDAISYKCFVVSSDANKGLVKRVSDRQASSSLELNLTYARNDTQRQSILSQTDSHSIYTPSGWKLYHWTGNTTPTIDGASWQEVQTFADAGKTQLDIMFGRSEYFNRPFKLVAYYTDEEAFIVNVRGDDNITSIKFLGIDMTEEGIKTSSSETRAELVVAVKEGYELDIDRLNSVVSSLYGGGSVGTLIPSTPQVNENGETTYFIYLNMKNINKNGTGLNVALNLYTKVKTEEKNDDLLWLWITLPIVVVLIVVGIVLFFLLRRRRILNARLKNDNTTLVKNNKKEKPKEKQADYKDFYY